MDILTEVNASNGLSMTCTIQQAVTVSMSMIIMYIINRHSEMRMNKEKKSRFKMSNI